MSDTTADLAFEALQSSIKQDYLKQIETVKAQGLMVLCCECRRVLSAEEIVFYEDRCESCEDEWSEKVALWRKGNPLSPEKVSDEAAPEIHRGAVKCDSENV